MLTSALGHWLRIQLNNFFMGKEKKNNVLTVFFISHKSDVKIFLKWILLIKSWQIYCKDNKLAKCKISQ